MAISAAPKSFMCTTPLISSLCKLYCRGCKVLCLCTPSCSVSPSSAACPHAAPRAVPCLCTQLSHPMGPDLLGLGMERSRSSMSSISKEIQQLQLHPSVFTAQPQLLAPAAVPGPAQLPGLLAEGPRCQHPWGWEQSTQGAASTASVSSSLLGEQSQNRAHGSMPGRALVPVSCNKDWAHRRGEG